MRKYGISLGVNSLTGSSGSLHVFGLNCNLGGLEIPCNTIELSFGFQFYKKRGEKGRENSSAWPRHPNLKNYDCRVPVRADVLKNVLFGPVLLQKIQ